MAKSGLLDIAVLQNIKSTGVVSSRRVGFGLKQSVGRHHCRKTGTAVSLVTEEENGTACTPGVSDGGFGRSLFFRDDIREAYLRLEFSTPIPPIQSSITHSVLPPVRHNAAL